MSMTEQGIHAKAAPVISLRDAIAAFNMVFDYDLSLPIIPEHVATAADLAEMRGRSDIAQDLRLALKQALEVDE
jgi:hypothetical protein